MAQIITDTTKQINSRSSDSNRLTTRFLPKLYFRILWLYYQDWLAGVESSPRSLKELGHMFKRRPDYISVVLCELERMGHLCSFPSGSSVKKRCISQASFHELDTQNTNQNTNQINPIPYIDPSRHKNDLINNINNPPNCGQLEPEDHFEPLETKLDKFMEQERIAYSERDEIKTLLQSSRIGPTRIEKVVARVVAANKKKPILRKSNYFLTCLQNEEKEIQKLCRYFRDKPINVNLYA